MLLGLSNASDRPATRRRDLPVRSTPRLLRPDGTSALGLEPQSFAPRVTRSARRGAGQAIEHGPETRFTTSTEPPILRVHSMRATSRRTRHCRSVAEGRPAAAAVRPLVGYSIRARGFTAPGLSTRSSLWAMPSWSRGQPGVIGLPSGRVLRGRGLRAAMPAGPEPEFGLYLQARRPAAVAWLSRWVRWRDFCLPTDPDDAHDALVEVWQRAETQRVEVACEGGRGRTGTALACIATP